MLCRAIAKHLPRTCFTVVSFWIGRSVMKNLNLSSSNMRFLANASEWQKATALENACHSEHNIAEWRISYQNMSFWMERSEMKNLLPRVRYCERSLTFVRDDICRDSSYPFGITRMSFWRLQGGKISFHAHVMLNGFALKNLRPNDKIPHTRSTDLS